MSKDDALVEAWRLSEFKRMGFSMPDAELLNEWQADLHEAQALVSAGCPLDVVMRILAPLDEVRAAQSGVIERVGAYSGPITLDGEFDPKV
jgi:hypothetical protein